MDQNGTGTRDDQWHESDTGCSPVVPATATKNPGALAGATGTDFQDWLSWVDHNLKRESAARALARAVADCDPADRVPFMETLIEGLCQGGPLPAFGGVMSAARDWARWASRVELKAYTLAAFEAMTGPDQDAFLSLIDRRAAA